ncbi:MAG: CDP-diacylglycerol--serine O-phosphatidyltransferase [Lautropia sp.]
MTDPVDSQDSGLPANGQAVPGPQPLARRRRRFRLRRNRTAVDRASVTGPAVADELFGAKPGFTPVARRPRGIYLLPNAFTTANLFAGFYAIVMAMNDQFAAAAIAIFLAMFLDSLDGRVARMTNTQSAFGEQYDSLADVISFGAAPALVMYSWALKGMGKWGWLAAFVYVAGAALRLARFNTNIHVVDKRFFQGLPSPAAAALIAGLVWIATDLREARWISSSGADLGWLAWIITVYAGLTMVSNSPFYSFKDINTKRSVPFIFLILLVLGLVLISSDPPLVLFSLFVVYGLSGHALALWRWSREVPALWKAVGRADVESARAPPDSRTDAPPDSSRAQPAVGAEPDGSGHGSGADSSRTTTPR